MVGDGGQEGEAGDNVLDDDDDDDRDLVICEGEAITYPISSSTIVKGSLRGEF